MTYNDGAEDVVPADVEPQKSVSEESLQGIMDGSSCLRVW